MNHTALIQNRKSVREFTDRQVSHSLLGQIGNYYLTAVDRLLPQIKTELYFFGTDTRTALEGAAGYNQFLVGAPQYLVLMTESHPQAALNAGYMMQDLLLKLADLDLDSCWITFASGQDVKDALGLDSELEVAAIAAFGYGVKTTKRLRLNIRSMSDIDVSVKRRFAEPKRGIYDMFFLDAWGNTRNLDDRIGFFDDMLWEAAHAASLAPSYLNRQAYGFVLHDGGISLVSRPDVHTPQWDGDLSLGIVLYHFSAVAQHWAGRLNWQFEGDCTIGNLPQDHRLVATCAL